MKQIRWKTAILVVLLHWFLILALLQNKPPDLQHKKHQQNFELDESPEIELIAMGGLSSGGSKNYSQSMHTDCPVNTDNTYFGIGIHYSWDGESGTIIDAPPGLPASNAGLRAGDIIPELPLVMPPPGTIMKLHVIRGDEEFDIEVTTTTVCYRENN